MRKGTGTEQITITEQVYIEGADVTLEVGDVIEVSAEYDVVKKTQIREFNSKIIDSCDKFVQLLIDYNTGQKNSSITSIRNIENFGRSLKKILFERLEYFSDSPYAEKNNVNEIMKDLDRGFDSI